MEEFKTYTLEELSLNKGTYGIAASAVPYDDSKLTYLRITDINDDGTLNTQSLMSVDEPNASDYLLKKNDIVFARTGNSTGRTYFYQGNECPLVYAGFLIKFSIDEKKVNPLLLKYYTHSRIYYDWVKSFDTGGTRGNINAKTYGNMPIRIPASRKTQDKIVDILSSLDEKIALNRRINDNLEQQAQALFKSWFVDFEPFKDGKFVESEMGMIPEGWKYIKLGKLCESVSITHPQKTGKLIFLNTGDIECGMVNKHNYMNINEMPGQAKKSIKENDILYSEIRPCNKHYAFVNFSADEYIVSTKLMVIRTYNNNSLRIYQFLTRKEIIDLLQHEAESRSGTFPQIRFDNISDLDILLATEPIEKQYSHLISGIYNKIFKNELEISKLQQLRDCILPKLMSGELKINDLNC